MLAPEIVDTTSPTSITVSGTAEAEVLGIAVLDAIGAPVHILEPDSAIVVRISVRALETSGDAQCRVYAAKPPGTRFRGHEHGARGFELPPMAAGDVYTVDFHLQLPHLYPSSFSFSPAIADGTLHRYTICDWVDNAITLQMSNTEQTGIRAYASAVPGGVEPGCIHAGAVRSRGLVEFTGERVVPGQVKQICGANTWPATPSPAVLSRASTFWTPDAEPAMARRNWPGSSQRYGYRLLASKPPDTRARNYPARQLRFVTAALRTASLSLRSLRCGGGFRGDRAPDGLRHVHAECSPRAQAATVFS